MVENKTVLTKEQIKLSFKVAFNSMRNSRRVAISAFLILILSNGFEDQAIWWWNLIWFGCLVGGVIFYLISKKTLNKKVDEVDYEIVYNYKFGDQIELEIDAKEKKNYVFEYKKLNRTKIEENIYYLYFSKAVLIVDINQFKDENDKEYFISKIQ